VFLVVRDHWLGNLNFASAPGEDMQ
jgi:hypothetical protein